VEAARKPLKTAHPFLVLRLFVLLLLALTPLVSLHPFFTCAHSFSLYILWLAAVYYANRLFLMGISFLVTLCY